jgi:hypothetical protein
MLESGGDCAPSGARSALVVVEEDVSNVIPILGETPPMGSVDLGQEIARQSRDPEFNRDRSPVQA